MTSICFGLCWLSRVIVITLLTVGLWNVQFIHGEEGFYAMALLLNLFGAVAAQKKTRDIAVIDGRNQVGGDTRNEA